MLVNSCGIPRFWATVWQCFLPADHARSTTAKTLRHIESLYGYIYTAANVAEFEDALGHCDMGYLINVLQGYFLFLRNRSPLTAAAEERWQTALRFIEDTVRRIALASGDQEQLHATESQLGAFRMGVGQLYLGRRRNRERIRSLPSEVVEALYEILDPSSPQNPFCGAASRWRVYTIFLLLLHQGLRRGELLALTTDAIKRGIDRRTRASRHWISVTFNEYEDDSRYSTPSIKNAVSVRQIPVSEMIAAVVTEYIVNYRGRPNHSFLINSQKQRPLSTERITKMFAKVSNALSPGTRKVLLETTDSDSISPHDLRHTCAVIRLNQILASGVGMSDAVERLRAFFGWARDSQMPRKYARAVFEHRIMSIWEEKFDDRVEILRNI